MKSASNEFGQQTLLAGQKKGIIPRDSSKIIFRYMDCRADCLYRMKLEAPIMEVIDEAVEESGVRGVLVGADDLVRRHRDHRGRPAGAGVRDDRLARMVASLGLIESVPYLGLGLLTAPWPAA